MDWSSWKQASCVPECWCEAPRLGHWILEPVNTWSNLGFIVAGLFFISQSTIMSDHANALRSSKRFPQLYGLALVFLGLGSFFYHASQTFVGQWFDVMGMYLVSMFYVAYNFYRLRILSMRFFLVFYVLSCSTLGLNLAVFPDMRRWLFGLVLIFTFFQTLMVNMKLKSKLNQKFFWIALSCYFVGQTVWLLDKNKIWCNPQNWMNGHGIWHILTCASAVSFYYYFHSEKIQRS